MNSIVVSSMVFAVVFAGALVGMALRRILPQDHLESDAKDVVRLATALVVTMTALVLGMLVSSAKASYDARKNEVAEMASLILSIDPLLSAYGPEAADDRARLRELVQGGIDRVWPGQASAKSELRPKESSKDFYNQLQSLTPKNDSQAVAKAQIISLAVSLRHTRYLMFIEAQETTMSIPLLVVLVAWLVVIFVSFGLFAPTNSTVVGTLIVCALAVSAAIFLIMEMYTPFSGVMRISPEPIRDALSQIGH